MTSDLLPPPAGCKIWKAKLVFPLIGFLKTDRISSMISSSIMLDSRCIFPMRPFLASISRVAGRRGMGMLQESDGATSFGKQMISLSYSMTLGFFPISLALCTALARFPRKAVGSCLYWNHYYNKHLRAVTAMNTLPHNESWLYAPQHMP